MVQKNIRCVDVTMKNLMRGIFMQHSQQATCTHIYVIFVLLNSIWLKQMRQIQGLFGNGKMGKMTVAHQLALSPHTISIIRHFIFFSITSQP
jgi:hypothetical protein